MILKVLTVFAAGAIVAATLVASAEAAPRKRLVFKRAGGSPTVFVSRDETGRTRTRILVTRRSFLDGGTEVLPGQRKFTDYVNPPNYRPLDILGPGKGYERQPFNGWFDYGYRNW